MCSFGSFAKRGRSFPCGSTVKSQIFVRYLISYFRTFAKSAKFNTGRKFIFGLEAIEFQCNFVLRPSKVRKLVRTNQFQVKSTKIGTGRKFVTLQYVLLFLKHWVVKLRALWLLRQLKLLESLSSLLVECEETVRFFWFSQMRWSLLLPMML